MVGFNPDELRAESPEGFTEDRAPEGLEDACCESLPPAAPDPAADARIAATFGTARVGPDAIEFPAMGDARPGGRGAEAGPLNEVQLRMELMKQAFQIMTDMISKCWFGFGDKKDGGGGNPFMPILERFMNQAMSGLFGGPGGPGARPGALPERPPARPAPVPGRPGGRR